MSPSLSPQFPALRWLGEEAAAVGTPRPGAQASGEELKRFVGQYLARFKVPAHVETRCEPLPGNANGKIVKSALRAHLIETVKDRVA